MMKKNSIAFTGRATIALLVCLSVVIQPHSLVKASADLKSESEFRNEASKYANALTAISAIATMKLDTPDALKKAIAIIDRERPNLRYQLSKYVVMAISDPTFSSAIKKIAAKKDTAEAFTKQVMDDKSAVLKLDGAQSLATRIRQTSISDADRLRRVAEHLKAAADLIRKNGQAKRELNPTAGFKIVPVSLRAGEFARNIKEAPATIPFDPATTVLLAMFVAYGVVIVGLLAYEAFARFFGNVFTKEGQEKIAACENQADDDLQQCNARANTLAFPYNYAALASCYADWLLDKAGCVVVE